MHPLEALLPTQLWTAGPDVRFDGDMEALRRQCGAKLNQRDAAIEAGLVKPFVPSSTATKAADLPAAFDSATQWPQCAQIITDIRDQSDCGCCWAFAAAEAASDRMCIATNASIMVPLSSRDLCFCASTNGCNGGELQPAWQHIMDSGLVTGGQYNNTGPFGANLCKSWQFPHCHHHGPAGDDPYPSEGTAGCPPEASEAWCPTECDDGVAGGHSVYAKDKYAFQGHIVSPARDEVQIMQLIHDHGPVEAAFTVFEDFANYSSGIYHHVDGGLAGGHAIKIVGWGVEGGTKYWKVANSWNPYWGENGYFRIARGGNECGIEDGVSFSPEGAKWSQGN